MGATGKMKGKQEREITIENIIDNGDILCEKCQKAIMEGYHELILYWGLLYHVKCWEKKCNEW